jgi:hypothetical protein
MDKPQSALYPVRCPRCGGHGYSKVLACGPSGSSMRDATCGLCEGRGALSQQRLDQHEAWTTQGGALRARRLAHNQTMGQAADHLALSVVDLSQMEHGLRDPAPLEAAWNEVSSDTTK